MAKKHPPAPVAVRRVLAKLGADISAARRRRRLPLEVVADRALTTRQTIARIEHGDPRVAMGTWATVLFVLGLSSRLTDLAAPAHDELGLSLEEERLPTRIRLSPPPPATRPSGTPARRRAGGSTGTEGGK